MARLTNPRMLDIEPMDTPEDGLLSLARPQVAGRQVPQVRPALNYQDIITQANQAGFTPYAGDDANQMAKVGDLEVTPYMEMTGQTEQDPGQSQQMGYTVSTPLGGTTYRADVVDMNGNLLRSNVHDAGADKYGLGDMAKMAAFALGVNYLPGLLGAEGSLTAGITPEAVAAAEAALPTALSSAPLSTALAAPLAELTSGGLLTGTGAPAAIGAPMGGVIAPEVMAAVAPELATLAPEVAGPGLQTITVTGAKAAAATTPWWAPAGVAAAVPVLGGMTSTPTAADPYANETAKLERQQPGDLGNMGGPGTPEIPTITTTGPLDGLKAWATANPEIAKLLFSGAGALLSATGGSGSSGGGGYVDSGYRPTISRGGFNAQPQARQMQAQPTGLLATPTTGQPMSGLWRYGLLGG